MKTTARTVTQHYWRDTRAQHVEIRCTQNSTINYKPHSHAEVSLGVMESGQTCLTCNETDIILSAGDMVLIPPYLVHSCNTLQSRPRSYHMIYINSSWCQATLSNIYNQEISNSPTEPIVIKDQILFQYYQSLAQNFQSLANVDFKHLNSFLFQTLESYWPFPPAQTATQNLPENLAKKIRQNLLNTLSEAPSLGTLAKQSGCTTETIIRSFRRSYGITPWAFLNNARIEKSKTLLRSGNSIVETALDVGFTDQSQFHRAFVAFCAATPKQYQDANCNK